MIEELEVALRKELSGKHSGAFFQWLSANHISILHNLGMHNWTSLSFALINILAPNCKS